MRKYKDKMTQSEQVSSVTEMLDTSQLNGRSNEMDIRTFTENSNAKDYGQINKDANVDSGMAYSASTKADGSPKQFVECDRFCKEHSVPASALSTGQKPKGMGTMGRNDDTANGGQ